MKAILLLLLVLCSCGTKKHTTDTQRKLSTTIDVVDSLSYRDSTFITEQLLSSEDIRIKIKVTEWSKPDSLGKQFPLKTTQADIVNTKKEEGTTETIQGSELDKKNIIDLDQIAEEVINEVKEVDNRLIPFWLVRVILCSLIIGLIYVSYKQNK